MGKTSSTVDKPSIWAPLNIPMRRRLQTLAAGFWIWLLVFGEGFSVFILLSLLVYGSWTIRLLCLFYLTFMYFDRDNPEYRVKSTGIKFFRDNAFFTLFREYFPINLVKTVNLKPDTNYLFAAFPHGILAAGIFGHTAGMSPKWKELFPGITARTCTLNSHFSVPIWRELMYAWGIAPSSKTSIENLLRSKDLNDDGTTSKAAVLVVGGAQESLYARPKNYQIYLNKRKGFIRIAIRTGAPLVPVFSFGEVDLFDQASNPEGSLLRRFQEKFKSLFGIAPPFFFGRGFFQYGFGWVPHRIPITTVVGAPILVQRNENPTEDEVNELHAKFITELNQLFETNKRKYIDDAENIKLVIE